MEQAQTISKEKLQLGRDIAEILYHHMRKMTKETLPQMIDLREGLVHGANVISGWLKVCDQERAEAPKVFDDELREALALIDRREWPDDDVEKCYPELDNEPQARELADQLLAAWNAHDLRALARLSFIGDGCTISLAWAFVEDDAYRMARDAAARA